MSARRMLLCIALLVAIAGCGDAVNGPAGDPSVAATVNGTDIPLSEVEERIESLRANPQFAQQLENDPDGAVLAQAQAEVLNSLIQTALLEQGASEELGLEVTDEDVQAEREALIEEVGGQEAFDTLVEQNGLSDEQVDFELRRQALTTAVTDALAEDAEVTDDQVQAFYEENRETRFGPTATARHILVADEPAARAVIDRLAAGEDFAAVATEVSTDTGSAAQGGDLGQLTPGQTVAEFDEAVFNSPVGQVVGPIQTEFGFHVLEVTERQDEGRALTEVEDEIRGELSQAATEEDFQAFLRDQAAAADVLVNPQLGSWNAETASVEATDPLGDTATPDASGEPAPTDVPTVEPS